MPRLRSWLQHVLGELHVYCRLRDCGVSPARARRWSAALGLLFRPFLYGGR